MEKRPAMQEWHACAGHARGAVTVRISHARWCSGTLAGGSVSAGRWQGAADELAGGTGRAPGKAVGAELIRAVARREGSGGCFGQRRSSPGREFR
jgi:hypothetical protein